MSCVLTLLVPQSQAFFLQLGDDECIFFLQRRKILYFEEKK